MFVNTRNTHSSWNAVSKAGKARNVNGLKLQGNFFLTKTYCEQYPGLKEKVFHPFFI
jgi:hypothetical protein